MRQLVDPALDAITRLLNLLSQEPGSRIVGGCDRGAVGGAATHAASDTPGSAVDDACETVGVRRCHVSAGDDGFRFDIYIPRSGAPVRVGPQLAGAAAVDR